MLESSVRLLLAMVRAKPRLALAPESRGRIAANVALFNILYISFNICYFYYLNFA